MRFYKISKQQFITDFGLGALVFSEDQINVLYDGYSLPKRATLGSAGYDFYAVEDIHLKPGTPILVPTGVRFESDPDAYLMCVPRSGLGFKHGIRLANTVGIIDYDYFFSHNEGHIFAKLFNPGSKSVVIPKGQAFMQGIINSFKRTDDDEVVSTRCGGFGSTDEDKEKK